MASSIYRVLGVSRRKSTLLLAGLIRDPLLNNGDVLLKIRSMDLTESEKIALAYDYGLALAFHRILEDPIETAVTANGLVNFLTCPIWVIEAALDELLPEEDTCEPTP